MRIPVEKDGMDEYMKAASERLDINEQDIKLVKILNKSLDASCNDQFYYEISIVVTPPALFDNKENLPVYPESPQSSESIAEIKADRKSKNIKERSIIAGFGPAGMFADLELIDYGIKPLIKDGKPSVNLNKNSFNWSSIFGVVVLLQDCLVSCFSQLKLFYKAMKIISLLF